jgi:hypothetical protein
MLASLNGSYGLADILVAALGMAGLLALSMRWPFIPLLAYWALYSFVSVFQLSTWRVFLAGVPVTVPDGIMLLMAVMVAILWLRRDGVRLSAGPFPLSLGMGVLLGFGLLSAWLGAIHGFSAYAIGIDLRALSYLAIGYAAARLSLPADEHERLLAILFVVGLGGLLVEQAVVTLQQFARLPGLSGSIANLRDIGAPFYLGKYGIFFLLLVRLRGPREAVAMVISTVAGLAAIVATFIRTAWLEIAMGIIVVAVLGGRRVRRRILVVLGFGVIAASVSLSLFSEANVIVQAAQGRLDFSLSTVYNDPTVAGRLDESRSALANLRAPQDWIFGVGLGLSVTDGLHPNEHNSFAWALSKQGIVGLALFCVVVVALPLVIGLRALKFTDGRQRALLLSLLAAHTANILGGYASGNLTFSAYTPLLGMSIAWIADLARRATRDRPVESAAQLRPMSALQSAQSQR